MSVSKMGEVYKCSVCGNIIEVLHVGGGELVCCGKPMILVKENSDEKASVEKHVPIISGVSSKKVKIGAKKHPMDESHYIEWIEATGEEGEVTRVFLKPGMKPEAKFKFKVKSAKAYCNLHGLWKSA